MLRNLERISRENYEIFVCRKMPKTLDITGILRGQKEQLRAGFQDRLVMTASIPLHRKIFHRCMCCVARRGSLFLAPHTAVNLFRLYYTMKQKCLLAMAFLRSRQYMRYAQAYKGEAERARLLRIYYTIFPRGKQEIFSLFPRLSVFSVTFPTLVPLRVSDFTHVVPLLSSAEHILDYTRFRAEGDAPLALRSFCRNSSYRLQ